MPTDPRAHRPDLTGLPRERLPLAQSASGGQARLLRGLLVVPDGSRRSELDRMRTAETVTSGAGMVRALRRVSDVAGLRLGGLDLSVVPHRRVVSLARYGMAAKATALRRHPEPRRLATLVATVRSLEAKAVDDALELFDVLMTNDLLARAARESRNEKLRRTGTPSQRTAPHPQALSAGSRSNVPHGPNRAREPACSGLGHLAVALLQLLRSGVISDQKLAPDPDD